METKTKSKNGRVIGLNKDVYEQLIAYCGTTRRISSVASEIIKRGLKDIEDGKLDLR